MPQILRGHPVCYLANLLTKLFYLFVPLFPDEDDKNQYVGNAYNTAWCLPFLFLMLLKQSRWHGRTLEIC